MGEHQHRLAHQCSPCEKIVHMKCEVKHHGDMGMGHLCLIMGGAFRVWLWLKWVGQLCQSKLLFCLENMLKKCWSSGEYPFWSSHDHRFWSLHCKKGLNGYLGCRQIEKTVVMRSLCWYC